MADKYIHIFGIPVDQLSFKLDVLRHIESQCNENLPLADDGKPCYYDYDDFFGGNATALDCVWVSYSSDFDINYIIGIKPTYSWDREGEPYLSSETRAREFIAKTLLPFVNQSKEKLRKLCQYIEAPLGANNVNRPRLKSGACRNAQA